jgi:uncharacterized protein (DUF488 family)
MPAVDVWTIGHSTRALDEFLALLAEHDIAVLADVRRIPESRRHPHFGQAALAHTLKTSGLTYQHFLELGGRRRPRPDSPNSGWQHEAFRGYADHTATKAFRDGITRLLELATRQRVAIMCAEALWWQCHRRLIADYLTATGHRVTHILGPGKSELHRIAPPARIVNGELSYAAEPDLLDR